MLSQNNILFFISIPLTLLNLSIPLSHSSDLFRAAIKQANLKLRVSEKLAFSTFTVLLSSIASKEGISKNCDHLAAFQFMTKQLVASIFE